MSRSINELLAEMMLAHPPTSEAEVRHHYSLLMERFGADHGLTSFNEVEEAIRAHLIGDDLVEEWIAVRQGMDAYDLVKP